MAMDIVRSFKGYEKVIEIADRQFCRTTRRRLVLIASAAVVLLVTIIAVGVATSSGRPPSPTSVSDSIKAVCSVTPYPSSCFSRISSARGSSVTAEIFKLSLTVAVDAVEKVSTLATSFESPANDKQLAAALRDCKELLDSAIDRLNDSMSLMQSAPGEPLLKASKIDDLRTWLSAAVTDQETCLDGFEVTSDELRGKMEAAMVTSTRYTSNSLAIAAGILGITEKLNFPRHRKLLSPVASTAR